MRPQEDNLIESQADIIEEMRAILVREGDDTAILNEARVALSDWFIATYPHLYPEQRHPRLRVIKGGGRRSRAARQSPLLRPVGDRPPCE